MSSAPQTISDSFQTAPTAPAPETRAASAETATRAASAVTSGLSGSLVGGPTGAAVATGVQAKGPDAAQRAVARNSHTFTRARGFGSYVRMLDGRRPEGQPGPFASAMNALRQAPDARWLDSGGGEGVATSELKNTEGFENLQVTLVSYESSAESATGYNVLTGRFLEDIPDAELGTNDIITDVYGPLAYSGKPHEVLRKYLNALKPDGQAFVFLGTDRDHYGKINQVITRSGKIQAFGDWVQSLPGLKVDLQKSPVTDGDGDPIGEVWIGRMRRDPTTDPRIPELETVWYRDGNTKEGEIVPRMVLREAGASEMPAVARIAAGDETRRALTDRVAQQSTEQFLDAFRTGNLTNPLMGRLSSLKPGDEWVNVGPMADHVGKDLDGQHDITFTNPAYVSAAQWVMERRAAGIQHRDFTYTPSPDGSNLGPGRGVRLITDYHGEMMASLAPDKTLEKYLGALREGGEIFVYLGLEKGGTGLETKVVMQDGNKYSLRGWLESIPGLDVKSYRGHSVRLVDEHWQHDENAFVRIRVKNSDEVRIPRLELQGTGDKSGDGVAVPMYREAGG